MSGNVWEWTRSLWGRDFDKPAYRYPYMIGDAVREDLMDDESMLRVVRGGSWGSRPGGARCAARGAFNPGDRGSNLGFRVVLRSSPVSIL